MTWPQIVFGWPAIGAATALLLAALRWNHPRLALSGVALTVPFLIYAAKSPSGWLFSPLIFATLCVAAILLHRGRRSAALGFMAPYLLIVGMAAFAVLRQGR